MAKSVEISAKSVELAIENGALELGVAQEDVTVELIESAKSGFLGIGAKPAKYLVTVIGSDEPEKKAPKKQEKAPRKEAPAKKEEAKEEKKDAPAREKKAIRPSSSNSDAEKFLNDVLAFICDDGAHVEERTNEDGSVTLEIVGENLGGIIGRRGETLDALQHITNLVANKKGDEKVRISLDAENYRAKRAEALDKFAKRAAASAIKYKRNKALEPMNAYERHIIHVALQDMENISTSSVGTEPNRRVVINYTGPDARPHRRRY